MFRLIIVAGAIIPGLVWGTFIERHCERSLDWRKEIHRTMEKSKIRVVYEYEFRRGTTVSETARNINAVFGEGSTTKATVGNWFKNFRDGDFSLANEPRGRPKTKVDNDHLRAVVESDPSQSTRELASIFNVSIPTILVHLVAIDHYSGC
ncbi:hypothetical protein DMN91_012469 [Ooceraea biroi]|uniref:Mos1 transposase HTH domain-containing protein n=1 Tax=Ooceraea biroi TaxID=2015173 RepID=A0A3L8D4U6_OOCBI|nr:hypothetical protein DMN91_012469 [Ooceraea biroi]